MAVRHRHSSGSTSRAPIPAGAFEAGKRTPRQAANAELHLAVVKAAARLTDEFTAVVKALDLSLAQYNVLRILRGAGPQGATCGQIIERLIQRDPDVTRLIDRLDRRDLITRERDEADRRVVWTRITEKGLELLSALDDPINDLHAKHLRHLSDRQVGELRRLIEEIST